MTRQKLDSEKNLRGNEKCLFDILPLLEKRDLENRKWREDVVSSGEACLYNDIHCEV